MTPFLDNRYTRLYLRLIERARGRERDYRHHGHHVIPRSIGGSNAKHNRVFLTVKEHYICHLLLVKMVDGVDRLRMVCAAALLAAQLGKPRIFKREGRLPLKRMHPRLKRSHAPSTSPLTSSRYDRTAYRRNCLGKVKATNGTENRTVDPKLFDELVRQGWWRGVTRFNR